MVNYKYLFLINKNTYNIIFDYIQAISINLKNDNINIILMKGLNCYNLFNNRKIHFINLKQYIYNLKPNYIIYISEGDDKKYNNFYKINFLYQHFKKRLYFLNIEQLSRPNILNFTLNIIKHCPKINLIDYSSLNILYLSKFIKNNIKLLEYPRCDFEIFNYPKKYDIACIKFKNSKSTRRQKIYNDMIDAGLNVKDIEGWGKERDNILFRCKILVNVHFDENYNIFEEISCNRCIYNDMIVISENCSFSDKIKLQNKIKFCKYEDIINTIKIVLD